MRPMRTAFEAALETVERMDAPALEDTPPLAVAPALAAALATDRPELSGGGHSLWDFAAAWTPEADPPPPPRPPPAVAETPKPSARPEAVAEELGLVGLKTPADLAKARRRFMWENHPDRRKDLDRELANRRVAIANMLLDRALAVMQHRRRAR
jgi:hypothetical protein